MKPIRLLADQHIYLLDEIVPDGVELVTFDPDQGIPPHAGTHDALLIRTVSQVTEDSIPDIGSIRWVGTASAGYDHIDIPYLASHGVAVGSAAGCNARAVAEYVLTLAIYIAQQRGWKFAGSSIGIVGTGFVGSTVANLARHLGLDVETYDPPRAQRDPNFESSTLEQVLNCDIITLHTPLIHSGPWKTYGWLDRDKLFAKPRKLLVQASRGGVADEPAVLEALREGYLADAIVDVWSREPNVNGQLLHAAAVATPHIAGYSNRAKRLATQMAIDHMVQTFETGSAWLPESAPRPDVSTRTAAQSVVDILLDSGKPVFPNPLLDDFLDYDRSLRRGMASDDPAIRVAAFRALRTKLPYREEYPDTSRADFPDSEWPILRYFREF